MPAPRLFTEHPASVGETYGEHFVTAATFSIRLLAASFCCAVHAILPFLFVKTGSRMINELHGRMVTHRCPEESAAMPAAAPEAAAE